MKIIKKNKKDIIIFGIIFLLSLIILKKYLVGHMAADSFNIFNRGHIDYAINYSFLDGRIIMGLIETFAGIINIPITIYSSIMMFLAIFLSCIAVIVLKNKVLSYKDVKNNWQICLITFICYYTIFNFLYIENLYFVEGPVMAISLLMYILAADCLVNKEKNYILKTLIMIFIGIIAYQATISMFYICLILFSLLKKCSFKEIMKNFIIAVIIGVIGVAFDCLIIKMVETVFGLHQRRGINFDKYLLTTNIRNIFAFLPQTIWGTLFIFPEGVFLGFVTITAFLVFIKSFDYKKEGNKINLHLIILMFMSIMLSFIPSIMNAAAFWAPRIRFSLGATLGIVYLYLFVNTNLLDGKKIISKLLILVLLTYGLVNSINYIKLTNMNEEVNKRDEINVYKINKYIEEYEKSNNVKVKYIKVVSIFDNVGKAFYSDISSNLEGISVSSLRCEWAAAGTINYYTNRNLQRLDPTEEEENTYFENVDPDLDYLCMGDTLYVSAYMY